MMLYLLGHMSPDSVYSVNWCAQYMFSPNHLCELELNHIRRYLEGTTKKGLVLNIYSSMWNIYWWPDSNFSGMYGHENPTDTSCFKIKAGSVITFADFPVLWK